MREKFGYELNTGLVTTTTDRTFTSDKAAWNFLAKRLNKNYKTGRHVSAILYKYVPTTTPFIHMEEHEKCFPGEKTLNDDRHIRVPVLSGYVCLDYDGNRWPLIEISETYNAANLYGTRVGISEWSDDQNIDLHELLGLDREASVKRLTLRQLKERVSKKAYKALLKELEENGVKVVA